jgi:signal peptide peptidase SppA
MTVWETELLLMPQLYANHVRELAQKPRPTGNRLAAVESRVAYLPVSGVLTADYYIDIQDRITALGNDEAVPVIVLHINSPGGSSNGCQETAEVIRRVAAKKPVEVLIEGLAASAAYWVASPATRIVASPSAWIGSIGCRFTLVDSSEAYAREGLKVIPVSTSILKHAGEEGTEILPEQIAMFQRLVDLVHGQFQIDVKRNRKLSEEGLNKVNNADIFTARVAQRLSLIDEVMLPRDFYTALERKYAADPYHKLTGRAALEQFLKLCNHGRDEEEEFLDLGDVLPSVRSRIEKQYPTLATSAAAFHEQRPAFRPRHHH